MSLEEAKDIAISMNQIPMDPPPRRTSDIFERIGDDEEIDPLETENLSEWSDWRNPPPLHRDVELLDNLDSREAIRFSKLELAAGNYKSAIELAKVAIEKTPDIGSSPDSAIYAYLARIYLNMGDFKRARSYLNKAQKMHDKKPRGLKVALPHHQSAILHTRAELLEAQGKLSAAHEARCMVLNVWSKNRTPKKAIYARIQVALNLKDQGRAIEAEIEARQAFHEAFRLTGRNSDITAVAVYALGEIMLAQGRPADALKLAKAQISITNKAAFAEPMNMMIRSRIFAGDVLSAQYAFHDAMKQYDYVMIAVKDNQYFFKKYILQNAGIIISLLKTGRTNEAIDLISSSLSIYDQIGVRKHYGTAEMVALRGMAHALLNEKKLALKDFSQSMQIIIGSGVSQGGDYSKKRRLSIIAEAYIDLLVNIRENRLEWKFGIDASAEAFKIAATIRDSKVQFALSASSARTAATRDLELTELVRSEQNAQKQISALQATLANATAAPSNQQDFASIQRLRDSIADLIQAREALIDNIKRKFPRYTEFANLQPVSLATIQQHLTSDEAFLLIWTARDKTYIWAIPHQGEAAFSSASLGYEELKHIVGILRRALEPKTETFGDIPDFNFKQAYHLYRKLLLPVEKSWKKASELLVVVQGPLGQLPLAVLPTSQVKLPVENVELFSRYRKVPWLIRNLSITRLPSASSLAMLRTLPEGDPNRRTFVGFGDPVFNTAQLPISGPDQTTLKPVKLSSRIFVRGIRLTKNGNLDSIKILSTQLDHLIRLPDTAEEIRSIASILGADPDQDVYLGRQATEHQVKSMNLANRKVIAFATHALIPGDLDGLNQPALAFCSPSITDDYDDGLLTMGEILMLNMNADWVVLSACSTGAADGAGAEAVSGLGRAFFYAGTRALLVSMWPVETTSAKMLTTKLFQYQKEDKMLTRSGALRKSMLSLIDDLTLKDDVTGRIIASYAHPFFWAPFIVVGDGG